MLGGLGDVSGLEWTCVASSVDDGSLFGPMLPVV